MRRKEVKICNVLASWLSGCSSRGGLNPFKVQARHFLKGE